MADRDWYCEDVISGKIEIYKIWEDDLALAFHAPDNKGDVHVLVIPKKHVASVLSPEAADGKLLKSMITAVQKVAAILGIDKTGKGFYVRFNSSAPMVTPHMHWHIIAPLPAAK